MPVALTSAGSSVAGFQMDVSYDQQLLSFSSARNGDPLTNAGKSLTAQPQGSGVVRLSAAGLNQNVIADGTVGYMTFALSSSFSPTAKATLSCSNSQGVSPQAQPVAISCRAGSVSAGCSCDVNKDGTVTVADVQLMINMALGLTTDQCDLNGDGKVDIADVQIVINAALGLGCNRQ